MIATITINPAIDKIYYIDDFSLNKLNRITDENKEAISPGGKGVNISIMLKKFGINTIAMGFTGGVFGKKLEQEVRRLGITTNFVKTEQDTRTDIFIIDNKNDTLTEINESGLHISDEDLFLFMDRYKKILNQTKTIILAGSLLPAMPLDFYGELIRLAKKKKVKTIIHTAPKYIDSAIYENAEIIFPDMRSTCHFREKAINVIDDCLAAGKAILKTHKGIKVILFSHLIEYVVAITRKKAFIFSHKNLHTANLLGFNDAIVSGIVYGLENDMEIREALLMGSMAGYKTIKKNEKYCSDLDKIIKSKENITIEEIDL
jgi:1-phosphofructokinase family hexose kinase